MRIHYPQLEETSLYTLPIEAHPLLPSPARSEGQGKGLKGESLKSLLESLGVLRQSICLISPSEVTV